MSMIPFPIPVVPFGPGSQDEGDAVLDCLPMPQGMRTYVAPSLPERADARSLDAARGVLRDVLRVLAAYEPGTPSEAVDLTTCDVAALRVLNDVLGEGAVQVLSRGYGNCRVGSTAIANCWRVAYFNSQDTLILNTIEITDLPEVVRAAPEDLADSRERLAQLIEWVGEA
ncbi:hydrogenase expression/formation protein [Paraburkholderia bannensis]|nr:hydrogenase expression/formation protein [Paraburkholderia bannensis]RQM44279.1 hydrogenase expression/formation protein [Paraburkholderia bannensis]